MSYREGQYIVSFSTSAKAWLIHPDSVIPFSLDYILQSPTPYNVSEWWTLNCGAFLLVGFELREEGTDTPVTAIIACNPALFSGIAWTNGKTIVLKDPNGEYYQYGPDPIHIPPPYNPADKAFGSSGGSGGGGSGPANVGHTAQTPRYVDGKLWVGGAYTPVNLPWF